MHGSRAAASGQINRRAVKRCGGATGDVRRDNRDSRGAARSAGKSPTQIMPGQDNGGRHCCRPPLSLRVRPCREGEAFAPGGFEERKPWTEVLGSVTSGVHPKPKLLQVSPRAPRQGRSPGGSPLGGFRTEVPFPLPGGPFGRSLRFRVRRDLKPKLLFRLTSPWTCVLGPCRCAAPGPKPGPARRTRSRSSFSPGDGAPT